MARHIASRETRAHRSWPVARTLQDNETRDQIQKKIKERRTEELKKWGYEDGGSSELLALAEACAEAASPLDRVVPLTSLAHRRFRVEVIDPLLAVPKAKKGKKKKSNGDKPAQPKGRLARAAKELLEREDIDVDEKRRVAGELALVLRTVGIKVDHPLRKKLEKYA